MTKPQLGKYSKDKLQTGNGHLGLRVQVCCGISCTAWPAARLLNLACVLCVCLQDTLAQQIRERQSGTKPVQDTGGALLLVGRTAEQTSQQRLKQQAEYR